MFVLEAEIVIGEFRFRTIHEVEITKSVDELADTAVIKLPTRFIVRQSGQEKYTEEVIKPGDPVKITLGYDGKYSGVEFEGYVKKVSPKIPLEIHCEDAIWLLRRKNISKVWQKTNLRNVLQEVVAGTALKLAGNLPEIELEKWVIKNANGSQVLQKLKEEFGLTIFINDQNELYCGLKAGTNIGEVVKYDLNYNLVENNLEFISKEERKIKVRYVYQAPDNKKKTVEVGDPDGELRTYHTSVVSSEAKLRELAEAEIEKLKYDGFQGDVKSFLVPYATRGMKAEVIDQDHPNMEGSYLVEKVVVSFGSGGARRTVNLGMRL